MRVASINIGQPRTVRRGDRMQRTAIDRTAVERPVRLELDGFVGDAVADTRHHGKPHQAVCCFPHEHYGPLGERLGRTLAIPSFGENLTTAGMLEAECCVGDTCRVGTGLMQISQPREPCSTLAAKHGNKSLVDWIVETGFCGFYARILEAGDVGPGDAIELVERPNPGVTLRRALAAIMDRATPAGEAAALARVPEMGESLSRRLRQRSEPGPPDRP